MSAVALAPLFVKIDNRSFDYSPQRLRGLLLVEEGLLRLVSLQGTSDRLEQSEGCDNSPRLKAGASQFVRFPIGNRP
jgi:hypothetical protein